MRNKSLMGNQANVAVSVENYGIPNIIVLGIP